MVAVKKKNYATLCSVARRPRTVAHAARVYRKKTSSRPRMRAHSPCTRRVSRNERAVASNCDPEKPVVNFES